MSKVEYSWAGHGHYPNLDAQTAGEELERIRDRHDGHLRAEFIVAESRNPGAPLHEVFEWADEIAGEQYRLVQASKLNRHIHIHRVDGAERPPVRAFVNIVRDRRVEFVPVEDALRDAAMRKQVMDRAIQELRSWKRRHGDLKEFIGFIDAIDALDAAYEHERFAEPEMVT